MQVRAVRRSPTPSRVPGLDEPGGEIARGGDEEGPGAAGDVGDLEVEDRVGGDAASSASWSAVWCGPGRVDQRLERVQDDLLGQ